MLPVPSQGFYSVMRSTKNSILVASLLIAAPAFGSTAVSEPSGFTRQTIQHGRQTVGITLNNPVVCAGAIVGNDATSLMLDEKLGDIADRLDEAHAYYVEIVGDTLNTFSGDRFDIDRAATEAAGPATLVLKAADHNSSELPLPTDILVGHRIIVRRHLTLADVFGTGDDALLHAGFRYEEADHILFYDRQVGGYATYYLCSDGETGASEWRKVGRFGNWNETIIPPATGLFVDRNVDAPVEFVVAGTVRTNDFVLPLTTGYNFIASPYPTSATPVSLQMNSANGFVAAKGAASADQIVRFNGTAYETYFLQTGTSGDQEEWRKSGDDEKSYTTAELLSCRDSIFIKKVVSDPDYVTRRSFGI